MTIALTIHRLAARWHATRSEDYLVQDYVRTLQADNETLRAAEIALEAGRLTPSGWYVLRRLLGVTVLAGIIVAVPLVWQYGAEDREKQQMQVVANRQREAREAQAPATQAASKERRERAARASAERHAGDRVTGDRSQVGR